MRKYSAIAAALAVLASGLLPAEHVHVARDGDGHHASVAHSHFQPHHSDEAAVVGESDHDGAQWSRTACLSAQRVVHFHANTDAVCQPALEPQTALTSRERAQVLFVSVHDPPWATPSGLRAPPSSRL